MTTEAQINSIWLQKPHPTRDGIGITLSNRDVAMKIIHNFIEEAINGLIDYMKILGCIDFDRDRFKDVVPFPIICHIDRDIDDRARYMTVIAMNDRLSLDEELLLIVGEEDKTDIMCSIVCELTCIEFQNDDIEYEDDLYDTLISYIRAYYDVEIHRPISIIRLDSMQTNPLLSNVATSFNPSVCHVESSTDSPTN